MPEAFSNDPDFANQPITNKSTGRSPVSSVTVASPNQAQAARILRLVPPNEGFHFYVAENRPVGVSAMSLREFLEKLGGVEVASVDFHLYLGDFERWIDMLGDDYLTHQVAELREKGLSGEGLRSQLVDRIEARYAMLTRRATGH